MAIVFNSSTDKWTVIIYSIAALIMASLGIYLVAQDQSVWSFLLAFTLLAGGSVPLQLAVPGTRYLVDDARLYITAGFLFRWEIELTSIVRVLTTDHAAPSPFRLATVRIDYIQDGKKRHFLLSPDNTHLFLEELSRAEPGLVSAEGCLLRVPS